MTVYFTRISDRNLIMRYCSIMQTHTIAYSGLMILSVSSLLHSKVIKLCASLSRDGCQVGREVWVPAIVTLVLYHYRLSVISIKTRGTNPIYLLHRSIYPISVLIINHCASHTHILFNHFMNQIIKSYLTFPVEFLLRFGSVTEEEVDLWVVWGKWV